MKTQISALLASAAVITLVTAPAQAAQVSGVCSLTDVTYNPGVSASKCAGEIETEVFGNDVTGNDGNPLKDQLNTLFGTSYNWSFVGKDESTSSSANGFDGYSDAASGTWSVANAITGPFAISVKGGTGFAVYLFENVNQAVTSGTWTTLGLKNDNRQGNQPGLSHISLFRAANNIVTPPPTKVPEPASLLGLGLVASGMVIARRRRSAA